MPAATRNLAAEAQGAMRQTREGLGEASDVASSNGQDSFRRTDTGVCERGSAAYAVEPAGCLVALEELKTTTNDYQGCARLPRLNAKKRDEMRRIAKTAKTRILLV